MSDDIFVSDEDVVAEGHLSEVPPTVYIRKPPKRALKEKRERDDEEYMVGGPLLKSVNYKQLHDTFDKWLYLEKPDHEALDIIIAAALDRRLAGDPVWLFLIAPSGGAKTEMLRSLDLLSDVCQVSNLTPKSLISGKVTKGGVKVVGHLKNLNQKIMVIKDFTTLLTIRKEDRYEILGQLRDAYDGSVVKLFGNFSTPIEVKSTFGLIAAVTKIIDKHQRVATELGERFLKIRQNPDRKRSTVKAYKNTGKEKEMREELRLAVFNFVRGLSFRKPRISRKRSVAILRMAHYISLTRAWVRANINYKGELVDIDIPDPEIPTRAAKQLGKLAGMLAVVRGHNSVTDEELSTLRRISKNTAIPKRQRIVEAMSAFNPKPDRLDGSFNLMDLADGTELHYNSVRIECEKMRQLGIVNEEHFRAPEDKEVVKLYSFEKDFRELVDEVMKGKSG